MAGTYTIVSSSNKRIYIGQTKDFEQRRFDHLSRLRRNIHGNIHLQRAFNKYGESDFVWSFQECDESAMTEMEQFYIDSFDPADLFNINLNASRPPTPQKGRISEKGLESLRNRIPYIKGKKHTEETRAKISKAVTGCKMPESQRRSTSIRMSENHPLLNPEFKKKQREAKKLIPTDQCLEIYNLYKSGISQDKLAVKYNIGRSPIRTAIRYAESYLIPK